MATRATRPPTRRAQVHNCTGQPPTCAPPGSARMLSARTALRRARRAARHARWLTGHYAGLPLNIRRSAGLVTADAPPVAYLGFAGRGNAGDDAIMLAHIRSLPDIRLTPLPLEWERQTLDLMGRLRKRPLHAGILVGG